MGERKTKRKFEDAIADLERIGAQLESGDLSLEEALAAYEAGIALVRELNQRLADAEARVQELTRGAGGDLQLRPLDPEDDAES
jgi:exodeoxyribonuclease VII small subunit